MRTSRRIAVVSALFVLASLGSASARSGGLSSLGLLSGLSGKLRAAFALPGDAPEGVPNRPGIYRLLTGTRQALTCFVLTPFSAKVDGRIGTYRMGLWPFERRVARDPAYDNPPGFIEVTPENFKTHVSEH